MCYSKTDDYSELGTRCVQVISCTRDIVPTKPNMTTEKEPMVVFIFVMEVLLINAEAKAELGIITQADIDKTVNLLRNRVGMPGLDISNIQTDPHWLFTTTGAAAVSPLLQEIRRERTVELACEGFRIDDIFRWAAADEPLSIIDPKELNYLNG